MKKSWVAAIEAWSERVATRCLRPALPAPLRSTLPAPSINALADALDPFLMLPPDSSPMPMP